jgi:hypothetical protein
MNWNNTLQKESITKINTILIGYVHLMENQLKIKAKLSSYMILFNYEIYYETI